jgi:hypothetical protein
VGAATFVRAAEIYTVVDLGLGGAKDLTPPDSSLASKLWT